jgi:uncharacterized protein YceH (UPF0502 family)
MEDDAAERRAPKECSGFAEDHPPYVRGLERRRTPGREHHEHALVARHRARGRSGTKREKRSDKRDARRAEHTPTVQQQQGGDNALRGNTLPHVIDVDPVQLRVLGCLIEKQRTTPDQYPLSLNALRLACNQATNREPVVDYDEQTVRAALHGLSRKELVRLASGPGSRAVKYRHLLEERLGLDAGELSLLAVLMLRGPQTLGELKQRTERMHRFESLTEIAETLDGLAQRELARRVPRRPGQKEERFEQLFGAADSRSREEPTEYATPDPLEERVRRLEAEFEELRRLIEARDSL